MSTAEGLANQPVKVLLPGCHGNKKRPSSPDSELVSTPPSKKLASVEVNI